MTETQSPITVDLYQHDNGTQLRVSTPFEPPERGRHRKGRPGTVHVLTLIGVDRLPTRAPRTAATSFVRPAS